MYNEGKIHLSPAHTKEEYINLHLALDSDTTKWNTAIQIFDDRIKVRFLDQIDVLKGNNLAASGFSIMALNCMLIETLMQFELGLDKTPANRNKAYYCQFLRSHFPDIFCNDALAGKFYTEVRCGILHSAQTGKNTALTFDNDCAVKEHDGYFYVSVDRFSEMINSYYVCYKGRLQNGDSNLRCKFIEKMTYICHKNDQ